MFANISTIKPGLRGERFAKVSFSRNSRNSIAREPYLVNSSKVQFKICNIFVHCIFTSCDNSVPEYTLIKKTVLASTRSLFFRFLKNCLYKCTLFEKKPACDLFLDFVVDVVFIYYWTIKKINYPPRPNEPFNHCYSGIY